MNKEEEEEEVEEAAAAAALSCTRTVHTAAPNCN